MPDHHETIIIPKISGDFKNANNVLILALLKWFNLIFTVNLVMNAWMYGCVDIEY